MKRIKTICVILILPALLHAQEYVFTKRINNYLRDGAGAYYPLIEILPVNTKLKLLGKTPPWLNVNTGKGIEGWVSQNTIIEKPTGKETRINVASSWSSEKASKAGLAAAIKGLKGKTEKTIAGDVDQLFSLTGNKFTAEEFAAFKKKLDDTYSGNRGELGIEDLDLNIQEYDPYLSEQQIGIGIASRLILKGIFNDAGMNKYVNLITNILTFNSEFYDWEFHTIILDDEKVDGFACPGGFIFITKKTISYCDDESELAAIIAHELAHIVRKHGLQEMFQRKTHIRMDEVFNELDEETDFYEDEVIKELEEMMLTSYEKIVHERLLEYELEADKIAAVLCANAGYDPFGIGRITKKLSDQYIKSADIFDDNYLAPNDMQFRTKRITEFLDDEFEMENPGSKFEVRFNEYVRSIK